MRMRPRFVVCNIFKVLATQAATDTAGRADRTPPAVRDIAVPRCDRRPSMKRPCGGTVTGGLVVAALAVAVAGAVISPASDALAAPARSRPSIARPVGDWSRSVTVGSVGLRISLKVSPERVAPGAVVAIRLRLDASHAVGALGYQLNFGDGTIRANPIPMYCLAGAGVAAHETWRFDHRYGKVGVYHVSVTGFVNCSSARAVARATVVVT